jgi:hypothetical protein
MSWQQNERNVSRFISHPTRFLLRSFDKQNSWKNDLITRNGIQTDKLHYLNECEDNEPSSPHWTEKQQFIYDNDYRCDCEWHQSDASRGKMFSFDLFTAR